MSIVSSKGVAFIAAHEGFVSKTYRDSAGVLTIGYGFTMGSKVFAQWWKAKTGRSLQMGDTISRADADTILSRLLDEEYAPPVVTMFPGAPQNQVDGCASVTYNAGIGALRWNWAKKLKAGAMKAAMALLRTTAVTAGGKRLAGLVRRRDEEAKLIEFGNYGTLPTTTVFGTPEAPSVSNLKADIEAYQRQLKTLGYYSGPVDGIAGPVTRAAVQAFQRDQRMVADGIVGPATRAALARAAATRKAVTGAVIGGAVLGGGSTAAIGGHSWTIVGGAVTTVILLGLAFLIWRNRGAIALWLKEKAHA